MARHTLTSRDNWRGNAIRVVAVEGNGLFRELLSTELGMQGFDVTVFATADALLSAPETASTADVIVLDWQLPEHTGPELLTELRRHGIDRPVVFLTGRLLVADELQAFARGAVDFIDKARGFDILGRRLRIIAQMSSDERVQRRLLRSGKLLLNPVECRAAWDGADVELTITEFRMVELLVAYSPQHVTYRELYDIARYPGFYGGHGTLGYRVNVRSAIRRIRTKFARLDPTFSQISNYQSLGYVWR